MWKGINQIISFKPQSSKKFVKIVENNQEISNPLSVANTFNRYFANIGSEVSNLIPNEKNSPLDYLNTPLVNNFVVYPTTTNEIDSTIACLDIGKAVAPFSIFLNILKILKSTVSRPLEIVFNASFMTGIVPSNFKVANIIPVYKTGSQTQLGNYSLISLLSIFNKILEKLMYKRLLKFLEKNEVFFDKQFGF